MMDNFNELTNNLKNKAEEAREQVKSKAHDVYESGKQQAHETQKMLQNNADDLINKIKEKPIHSVLIAAGIGFLISKFIR